ncbi:hypothetical protein DSM106972_054010 [Dulcicalothrix desertica PCC 7102]|uniref:DUF4832 domain-containing protein n=2 Tax=Dulcicalothrix desertica TaxID=32056 RepID=A0A433VAJ8_9CYAN|nr:hypothetical protein DSM106972_054010 [Dulcicalothrix desertica PCC 7102]
MIVDYQMSDEYILNPERGFYTSIEIGKDKDLSKIREQGFTLARSNVHLDQFRDKNISEEFLQEFRDALTEVRRAGIKVIPRISYNFPMPGETEKQPDAPLPIVLNHIEQLKPIFQEYQDVIAALPAGFIGAWGEWHSSTNGLHNFESKQQVLTALLDALPSTRMVQLRYPSDIKSAYPNPLNDAEAFTGIHQARIGHENLCFLANADDAGTYSIHDNDSNNIYSPDIKKDLQSYLKAISPYVIVGGETCQVTPESARTDSETTLAEMQHFNWSYINVSFYAPTIDRWKKEGIYNTIANKLGYRFRLVEAQIPEIVNSGGEFKMSFTIANDGFASPYNPRSTEIILRNQENKQVYRFPVYTDARRWFSQQQHQVNFSGSISVDMPKGTYEVLLNLPDPTPQLYERPEYSIRLANQDVWEPSTGYNSFLTNLSVN